jgi:hypothetical protein
LTARRHGLLLSLLLIPVSAGARPPEADDAEQRRALSGLGDTGPGLAPPAAATVEREPSETMEIVPEEHAVTKGDTLWDICETYFHDPWRWPKIWALNPEITNPHWIFPGQTLRLGGMNHPGAAGLADGARGRASRSPLRFAQAPKAPAMVDAGTKLREVGFVDSQELAYAGTIKGSRDEKIMLASGDQAYVEFSQMRPLKIGERFTVYQVDTAHPVKDPHSSITLGYLVHIYGDVSIDALTDRPMASGTLIDLVEPVERGYLVGPLFRQFKTIKPRPNAVATTAHVVAAVQPNLLIVEGMLVLLDRGSRHGVEVGNRFMVIRQGDGHSQVLEDWDRTDPRFPPDPVAEILAVDVREELSVGWVLRGDRTVRIGDPAELRKGH